MAEASRCWHYSRCIDIDAAVYIGRNNLLQFHNAHRSNVVISNEAANLGGGIYIAEGGIIERAAGIVDIASNLARSGRGHGMFLPMIQYNVSRYMIGVYCESCELKFDTNFNVYGNGRDGRGENIYCHHPISCKVGEINNETKTQNLPPTQNRHSGHNWETLMDMGTFDLLILKLMTILCRIVCQPDWD